jgi:hypothetical protein
MEVRNGRCGVVRGKSRGIVAGLSALLVGLVLCSCDEGSLTPNPGGNSASVSAPATSSAAPAEGTSAAAQAPAAQAPAAQPVPSAFVAAWGRHSTQFVINADGTGKVVERTYTPCGTSQDCAFNATLAVSGASPDSVTISYSRVWFTGDGDAVMTLSAADHKALDPYFPLAGERATGTLDAQRQLHLKYMGPFAKASQRTADANTYCGKSSVAAPGEGSPCGA